MTTTLTATATSTLATLLAPYRGGLPFAVATRDREAARARFAARVVAEPVLGAVEGAGVSMWPEGMAIRPIQQWPGEFTRTRQRSRFDSPWSDTLALLGRELRMLGARAVVLQVAMQEADFRNDGYPRAQAKAEHPGIILSLTSKHGPLSWPCDTFTTWQDNLRGVALAMEALRKVDRYGVTKRGEQYTGWKALPAGRGDAASGMTATDAAEILVRAADLGDVSPSRERFVESGTLILRRARSATHPDRNAGDTAQWHLVDNAEQTLRHAGWLPKSVTR